MTLSLNVLRHLGIGLYSNVPAVLSELVANSWDADAARVEISVDTKEGVIEVKDTGCGMTRGDINERFLKVGYQRREEGDVTDSGRAVMGRKGIGKLSAFSIAQLVEVHTIRDGQKHAFRMDRNAIESRIKGKENNDYHPEHINPETADLQHGTRLVLRGLNRDLSRTVSYLRQRLARRFSIIGSEHSFEVTVNGEHITPRDRGFHNKLEFLWYFGEHGEAMSSTAGFLKKKKKIKSVITVLEGGEVEQTQEVSGWIGTVDKPETLDEVNNAIVLMARGKLVHEDLLPEFKEAGVYADYVLGEINADFLDTDEEDIITSGRQSVKEDAPRYMAVIDFVGETLKTVKNEWTGLRKEQSKTRALAYPTIKEWYDGLGPDRKKTAERLFGKIESLRLRDTNTIKELYRSSILAFEKLALKDMLSALDTLETEESFDALVQLISGIDEIEAVHYYEVAKGRLAVISEFAEMRENDLEKVLQRHIFNHLWLLHPSWERAASNSRIEQTVQNEFGKINARLSQKEKKGRIDIRYRTAAGKHIIVELKKYDRTVRVETLLVQLRKYRDALHKCLRTRYPEEPTHIEVITILGSPPTPADKPRENEQLLRQIGARYVTYDQLVLEAERSYERLY
ncbi:MAG: ATP-binding protein [Bacteroidetes bacterium]|nr:ATP-binding protein [Bacteroidota bacterium]